MKTLLLIIVLSLCPVDITALHAQAVSVGGEQVGQIIRSPDSEGGAAWTYHGNDGSSVNGYSSPDSVTVNPSTYQPGWYETLHRSQAQPTAPAPPQPRPVEATWLEPIQPLVLPMPYPVPVPVTERNQQQPQDNSSDKLKRSLASLPEHLRKKFWNDVKTDFKIASGQQLRTDYLLPYYRLWFRSCVTVVPATP